MSSHKQYMSKSQRRRAQRKSRSLRHTNTQITRSLTDLSTEQVLDTPLDHNTLACNNENQAQFTSSLNDVRDVTNDTLSTVVHDMVQRTSNTSAMLEFIGSILEEYPTDRVLCVHDDMPAECIAVSNSTAITDHSDVFSESQENTNILQQNTNTESLSNSHALTLQEPQRIVHQAESTIAVEDKQNVEQTNSQHEHSSSIAVEDKQNIEQTNSQHEHSSSISDVNDSKHVEQQVMSTIESEAVVNTSTNLRDECITLDEQASSTIDKQDETTHEDDDDLYDEMYSAGAQLESMSQTREFVRTIVEDWDTTCMQQKIVHTSSSTCMDIKDDMHDLDASSAAINATDTSTTDPHFMYDHLTDVNEAVASSSIPQVSTHQGEGVVVVDKTDNVQNGESQPLQREQGEQAIQRTSDTSFPIQTNTQEEQQDITCVSEHASSNSQTLNSPSHGTIPLSLIEVQRRQIEEQLRRQQVLKLSSHVSQYELHDVTKTQEAKEREQLERQKHANEQIYQKFLEHRQLSSRLQQTEQARQKQWEQEKEPQEEEGQERFEQRQQEHVGSKSTKYTDTDHHKKQNKDYEYDVLKDITKEFIDYEEDIVLLTRKRMYNKYCCVDLEEDVTDEKTTSLDISTLRTLYPQAGSLYGSSGKLAVLHGNYLFDGSHIVCMQDLKQTKGIQLKEQTYDVKNKVKACVDANTQTNSDITTVAHKTKSDVHKCVQTDKSDVHKRVQTDKSDVHKRVQTDKPDVHKCVQTDDNVFEFMVLNVARPAIYNGAITYSHYSDLRKLGFSSHYLDFLFSQQSIDAKAAQVLKIMSHFNVNALHKNCLNSMMRFNDNANLNMIEVSLMKLLCRAMNGFVYPNTSVREERLRLANRTFISCLNTMPRGCVTASNIYRDVSTRLESFDFEAYNEETKLVYVNHYYFMRLLFAAFHIVMLAVVGGHFSEELHYLKELQSDVLALYAPRQKLYTQVQDDQKYIYV